MEPSKPFIDKLAWVTMAPGTQDGQRLLVVRSRGRELFYLPGGKREPGETDHQALVREVREELGVTLVPEDHPVFVVEAPADGKPGTTVRLTCYAGPFEGVLTPCSEIEELAWLGPEDRHRCSVATLAVFDALGLRGPGSAGPRP